jgi:hypothetical protein
VSRTANDIEAQREAAAGLRAEGITFHLRTYPSAIDNAAQGSVNKGAATDTEWFGSPPLAYATRLVDGDLIRSEDTQLFVPYRDTDDSVLAVKPSPIRVQIVFDKGTASQQVWDIVRVTEHRAGNEPAVYELQLRRA